MEMDPSMNETMRK